MRDTDWRIRLNPPFASTVPTTPDWHWDTKPGMADYDFLAIHAGKGLYRRAADGQVMRARAGTCILLRKGQRYIATLDGGSLMTVTYAHFDYVDGGGGVIDPPPELLGRPACDFPTNHLVFRLLDRMVRASRLRRDHRSAEAWLKTAILEYIERSAEPARSGAEREAARQIEAICREIRQAPERPWRVAELAERMHYTPDHFGRLFRALVGQPPGDFVVEARVDAAMTLLRTSDYSVTRIADLLGYSDVYALSRQFRQKTGMPPTIYRRGTGPEVR